jgi:hypothetical protein
MNKIQNNGENDQSLQDGLDKLSQDYERLKHDEPPEMLDQAILNSAHRVAGKKPHWMQFGWLHGLTTAAVFVLAFSLILNQREPVPINESGARSNEVSGLQREKAAKKQSLGVQSDDFRNEETAERQNAPRDVPAAATAESPALEITTRDLNVSAPLPTYIQESRRVKVDRTDNVAPAKELKLEERLLDEADVMIEAEEAGDLYKLSQPASAAELLDSASKTQTEADPGIEQKLLKIIESKQSGDETWKTELEVFRQNYPDYPLPPELTGQG